MFPLKYWRCWFDECPDRFRFQITLDCTVVNGSLAKRLKELLGFTQGLKSAHKEFATKLMLDALGDFCWSANFWWWDVFLVILYDRRTPLDYQSVRNMKRRFHLPR
ncbi:hypothetical protein K457DRAFT_131376 [Linnemannia elongata AG-77]|uniref:Uncharacterized protein n=1 Tax=Linnemannia elongata AG-77 TaxID=1314771 RepID=A0A197JCS7_9FUNG|nr:hypothetical protein K457DRAFT_131376 [Linnemannia elongata AG-77]